jgi:hypothetical protein
MRLVILHVTHSDQRSRAEFELQYAPRASTPIVESFFDRN